MLLIFVVEIVCFREDTDSRRDRGETFIVERSRKRRYWTLHDDAEQS